jgi:hypothetical protein
LGRANPVFAALKQTSNLQDAVCEAVGIEGAFADCHLGSSFGAGVQEICSYLAISARTLRVLGIYADS